MLALARDAQGIRPLHVVSRPAGLVAASEIWPLLAELEGPPALDGAAVAHLLAFQFLPPGRTLFEAVTPVRPGEILLYDASARLVRREPLRFAGAGRDPAELSAALREAAALQGPRACRSAVFLSGGLDSSGVAGLLAEAGHPPDLAVTGWFPEGDPALDERPHARAVAAELRLPLAEVPIRAADALEIFPALVRALGGPLAGPGAMAQFLLARFASEDGVRVVYSGEGGDELFGGYERHRLLQQIEAGAPPEPLPGYAPMARAMAGAADPLAAAVFRGAELLPLLSRDAQAAVTAAARDALPPPGPARSDRALAFEAERFLPGLLAVDDATLSAFGIEGRVPLLDPVVAAAASRVPLAHKSPPPFPRRLFRSLLGAALPLAASRRRDKMGFPMPLETWLSSPPWREFALDRLRPSSLARFGLDGRAVRSAFEQRSVSARGRWFLLGLDVLDELLAGRA
jgi:asparagine synthase (glutamine-hydrolysing)